MAGTLSRQDSSSSAGSGASGMSGASSVASAAGGGADDLAAETASTVQKTLYGFLCTLYKERWEDNKRFLVGRVLLEHLQLLLILMQAQFLWTFDASFWLFDILNYSLLKKITVSWGYDAYGAVLYIMVAVTWACVAGCGWVAYKFSKDGVVPNKWPMKLLRLFVAVVFKVFYITVLNFLLGPANCSWLVPAKVYYNFDFPSKNCMAMPHLATLAISGVTAVVVIAVHGVLSLAEVTPNPISQNWLASAHSEVEVKTWVFKTAIVLSANILTGNNQVQAIIILLAAGWIVYVHIRYQPYLFQWVNHLRTGAYAMAANTALLLTINMYAEVEAQTMGLSAADLATVREARSAQLTLYMLVLLPAALVLGTALSWLRLNLWVRPVLKKFRGVDFEEEGMTLNLKDIHKFYDAYEVELVARCCRNWDDYEDNIINPDGVQLASYVIKSGLARFPDSAHMVLVYINFLSSVQDNQQACNSQLQAAHKLQANWCDRFVFYVREQQQLAQLQAHTGQSADAAVDLVGYVEFQRNFKAVLRAHKAALYAIRAFWKQLLHSSVAFNNLTKAFAKIQSTKSAADRAYQTMLERYPSNIRVLRAYARFVEGVNNDPWAAAKYFAEADRLEEVETAEAAGELGDDMHGPDMRANAVCVINAQGIIQMANKPMLQMFGYKKGEVEGKNVSILMPQPFSNKHNTFLRNYTTTGKAKILDQVREVVGLHRDCYVFPLTLLVTKVSGSGPDAVFMGVLKPLPQSPDAVRAWVMPAGGTIMCVDRGFADWFGLAAADCLGKGFPSLAVDADVLQGLLEKADKATYEEVEAGLVGTRDVMINHKYSKPLRVDITLEMAGTEAERIYKAVIRKRETESAEYLMVVDKRGRIVYITTKLANLLGFEHTKELIKTEFMRFMAQPFMQLHGKWMRDMPSKVPTSSCRNGTPVVLITQQRTPVPCTIELSTKENGDDSMHIVKVIPTAFNDALRSRRLSLRVDAHGQILAVGNTPAHVFGLRPSALVGRNLNEVLDIFTGIPVTGGAQGLDMEHVMTELVHKCIEQKEANWRCGLHPPMSAEDVAAAKRNVVQNNLLNSQTKPAVLQLELEHSEQDEHTISSITAHVWRADMLTGVLEVDKDQMITKAGCCPLHQPGLIFGISSSAMLHTTLAHWLSVPPTYEGLLLDTKKKSGGVLKKKAADIKTGPLLHASGQHFDGDKVRVAVQAVVKEGTGGAGLLVVKLTTEKNAKGNPNFARRLLGLPEVDVSTSGQKNSALAILGGLVDDNLPRGDSQAGTPRVKAAAAREPDEAERLRTSKAGGVRFGGGGDEQQEDDEEVDEEEDGKAAGAKSGKDARLLDWVTQASGLTATTAAAAVFDEDYMEPEESQATFGVGMPMPPMGLSKAVTGFEYAAPPDAIGVGEDVGSKGSGVDEDASQEAGSDAGDNQSDFKRGRRLRKLARMLNSKPAQKYATRFYSQTVLVLGLLLVAHLACFIASVVMLDAQKQYIDEVDDAGVACIAMHRMAIDCRVLDALSRGITKPGIFEQADKQHFLELFADAADQFEHAHEATYMGRGDLLRRFVNRQKYKLQDYWEMPHWPVKMLVNISTPPVVQQRNMSLWQMGNLAFLSSREVMQNIDRMLEKGHLSDDPFWYFVMNNAGESLYQGYKRSLYGLVERALAKIGEVRTSMVVLMVVESCLLFTVATVYVCLLVHRLVRQRAELFSIFLVIPAGFLRALASKQVQLDEDDDSDGDSEAGDGQAAEPPPPAEAQKLNLNLGPKRGGNKGGRGKQAQQPLLTRLSHALNPFKWFAADNTIVTGKRQLVRNSRDMWKVGLPIMVMGAVIIIVYGTSIQQLDAVHGPFQMLNIIHFLVFRVTRSVLYSLECVLAGSPAKTAIRQGQVAERLENLRQEYISFLYGFEAVGAGAVRSDLSTEQAALFQTTDLANIFFRTTECMRADKSTCYPQGHKFYTATHSGLDAMFNRFHQEGSLLVHDNATEVDINSARFEYIWQVGRFDLFEGMNHADQVFRSTVSGSFDQMRVAHVVVFVISLTWAFVMWLWLVRPMLRHSGKESRQIAEMLSQLPPEMDVEGLVAQAIARTGYGDGEDGEGSKRLSGGAAGAKAF